MWNDSCERELVEIFSQLIKCNSANPTSNEKEICEYIQNLLSKDGIESIIIEKQENRSNIVAKIGEKGEKPVLLLSHIDVVPEGEGWTVPAFDAYTKDGIIYGRGAIDTKHLTAMEIMAMLLLKREGIKLNREIVLLASADEENGSKNGMEFVVNEHSELIPNDCCTISEGGGFVLYNNGNSYRTCTCGEKGNCNITVDVKQPERSRNSCLDIRTSRAYSLLTTFSKLSQYDSENVDCVVTRTFLKVLGNQEMTDKTVRDLWEYTSQHNLVINRFDLREKELLENSELKLAVDFKFIPTINKECVEKLLSALLKGLDASFTIEKFEEGFESGIGSSFIKTLVDTAEELDVGTKALPMLALGRTDGRFIKGDVYGFSPMLGDIPFSHVLKMVHGKDECISIASLVYGTKVIYNTLRKLSAIEAQGERI